MDKQTGSVIAAAAGGLAAAGAVLIGVNGSRNDQLVEVASFNHQVTGVTISPDGRIFVNFPRWTDDAPISVAELKQNGSLVPYPDERWNAWRNEKATQMPVQEHFVCVQSVVTDRHGALWVLDPAAPGNEKILPGGPKLVRIDLATNCVTKVIPFSEEVALQGTYLNDIRFSPDGKTGYITDSGTRGAIIVVDLESGEAFRALDGHASTQMEKDVVVEVDGAPLRRPDGRQPAFASDGIAMSVDGAMLYWQALTGKTLYSIPTAALTPGKSPSEIEAAVTALGESHVADGFWMSRAGILYLTSPSDNSVRRWTGSGTEPVVTDNRLRWPDTMSEGPDGMIYVTASRIQDTYWFKSGAPASLSTALFRFPPAQRS
ncbi:major royal jelly family protein [Teichococcus vastitatis]|uniref:Major royal jelly family protein n=1 Tax=Teichococcus vastitatis TaxID=2307076 RepID=A0ABS9WAW8_9PROT|nr:major royal jelly family protein [Pseudoroseomonas vastitatis]MCI0756143.1 major royal jelly family protein [Pseudoroseomonas vastitatis]